MELPDGPISHAPKVRVEFHVVAEINGKEKAREIETNKMHL
ncbi:hypothetical protein [Arthrobacter sp. Leaf137]|nr:hypothetical protein [Arthrobacter sp. Leaf137]